VEWLLFILFGLNIEIGNPVMSCSTLILILSFVMLDARIKLIQKTIPWLESDITPEIHESDHHSFEVDNFAFEMTISSIITGITPCDAPTLQRNKKEEKEEKSSMILENTKTIFHYVSAKFMKIKNWKLEIGKSSCEPD
jgi:hypothetical protein